MFRFFLAGRYTLVRPVSYLAMVSIGLSVMALIVVLSIMNGFLRETENVIRGSTADIVVFPIQRFGPTSRTKIEGIVSGTPGVESLTSRLIRPAIFKVHGRSNPRIWNSMEASRSQVLVQGIDVDAELAHSSLPESLNDVRDPEVRVDDQEDPFYIPAESVRDRRLRNAENPGILMGEDAMRVWGLRKGDAVDLATLPDGFELGRDVIQPSLMTFIVSGAFNSGHSNDDSIVYIDKSVAKVWAGTDHELSELYITAEPDSQPPELLKALRDQIQVRLLAGEEDCIVHTWEDRNRTWLAAVKNERRILLVILGFFLVLVCTITFSVLTMLVQEKVRDIGVLSAMGTSAGGIGSIFAMVGVTISLAGGIAGLLSGVWLANNINNVKDLIEEQFGVQIFDRNVYAFSEIPVELDMYANLLITVATVLGAAAICLIPAWRAARLDPVEALRYE
jgi:lipoprotein-releasing system permease protein